MMLDLRRRETQTDETVCEVSSDFTDNLKNEAESENVEE